MPAFALFVYVRISISVIINYPIIYGYNSYYFGTVCRLLHGGKVRRSILFMFLGHC